MANRGFIQTKVDFKTEYGKTEEYVQKVRVKSHRSLLAQLREGTAPLQIETGSPGERDSRLLHAGVHCVRAHHRRSVLQATLS